MPETALPARRRILVVDDEMDVRHFVAGVLEDEGYDVATAENGQEALDQIDALQPDLVILDLMMPVLDGWAVLQRLRAEHSSQMVLVLSAFPDEWRAMRMGAWECLGKPFDHKELVAACSRALSPNR